MYALLAVLLCLAPVPYHLTPIAVGTVYHEPGVEYRVADVVRDGRPHPNYVIVRDDNGWVRCGWQSDATVRAGLAADRRK